jgi:uncharacterized membrane protein YeaQ/YmgE (transglycosylase-associated protein family)
MTKRLQWFGILGIVFTLLGFLAKGFLREYASAEGINEYSITGWLPSFLYVVGFSLLLLMRTLAFPNATIGIVILASLLFEIMQGYRSGNFDFPDLIASVAGGAVSVLIYLFVTKKTDT